MRQFNNWEDVGHWISENINEDDLKTYSEVKEASFYFFAEQESDMLSDMNAREQANLIMEGLKPLRGDEERVKELLGYYYELEGSDEDNNEYIIKQLKAHFGLKH